MTPGLSADGPARLRDATAAHVADDRVPGLVYLVARGDEVHAAALGTLTAGTDRPAQGGPDGRLVAWDEPGGYFSKPPAFPDGAAGLVSTADDMLAFARMFLRGGGPVLTADAVPAMTTDQLSPEVKARGGLGPDFFAEQSWGFCQAVRSTGAFGWDGGFGTTWLVDPGQDLVVIVMTQRMFDGAFLPAVHQAVQDAAYAALA